MSFPTIDSIEQHISKIEQNDVKFDDIATRYCVIRNESVNNYTIFFDIESI